MEKKSEGLGVKEVMESILTGVKSGLKDSGYGHTVECAASLKIEIDLDCMGWATVFLRKLSDSEMGQESAEGGSIRYKPGVDKE